MDGECRVIMLTVPCAEPFASVTYGMPASYLALLHPDAFQ
jgi:hypothetical protein